MFFFCPGFVRDYEFANSDGFGWGSDGDHHELDAVRRGGGGGGGGGVLGEQGPLTAIEVIVIVVILICAMAIRISF